MSIGLGKLYNEILINGFLFELYIGLNVQIFV